MVLSSVLSARIAPFFVFAFVIGAIFGDESYPPPVNVSDMYTYDGGPWEKKTVIPLINMRDYLVKPKKTKNVVSGNMRKSINF